MQSIVCEMCGSNDLIEKDGLFVCQHCHTKYTVEEAKKLMVTFDNSGKVQNLMKVAKQAQAENNYEKAGKYYDLVLQEDAENWEAAFYSVYDSAMCTNIAGIENAVRMIGNCVPHVLSLIRGKNYEISDECTEISNILCDIMGGFTCLYVATMNHYKQYRNVDGAKKEEVDRVRAIIYTSFKIGDLIETLYAGNSAVPRDFICVMWKYGINTYKSTAEVFIKERDEYISKITKYDPEYKYEPLQANGGCYIATAVYGSYDCPQVWTLRRFRDLALRATWYGRLFVRTYYAVSPHLVRLFGNKEWFKRFWRKFLDRMVARLQKRGYETSPYND